MGDRQNKEEGEKKGKGKRKNSQSGRLAFLMLEAKGKSAGHMPSRPRGPGSDSPLEGREVGQRLGRRKL